MSNHHSGSINNWRLTHHVRLQNVTNLWNTNNSITTTVLVKINRTHYRIVQFKNPMSIPNRSFVNTFNHLTRKKTMSCIVLLMQVPGHSQNQSNIFFKYSMRFQEKRKRKKTDWIPKEWCVSKHTFVYEIHQLILSLPSFCLDSVVNFSFLLCILVSA